MFQGQVIPAMRDAYATMSQILQSDDPNVVINAICRYSQSSPEDFSDPVKGYSISEAIQGLGELITDSISSRDDFRAVLQPLVEIGRPTDNRVGCMNRHNNILAERMLTVQWLYGSAWESIGAASLGTKLTDPTFVTTRLVYSIYRNATNPERDALVKAMGLALAGTKVEVSLSAIGHVRVKYAVYDPSLREV